MQNIPKPGTIIALMNNQKDNPLTHRPILQILNIEKMTNLARDQERIKANLSDGQNYVRAIFSTKYTAHFEATIKNFDFVKIGSYDVRNKENSRFVYVTDLVEFWEGSGIVGTPVGLSDRRGISRENSSIASNLNISNNVKNNFNGGNENKNNYNGGNEKNNFNQQEKYSNSNFGHSEKNNFSHSEKNNFSHSEKNNFTRENNINNFSRENNINNFTRENNINNFSHSEKNNFTRENNINNFSRENKNITRENNNEYHNNEQQNSIIQQMNNDMNQNREGKKKSVDTPTTKKQNSYTPIASLTPFTNKWTLKGRCTSKSDLKIFTNQKGEGKLFSVYLADSTGKIKITAFSDTADLFFPLFDVNKTYTISMGQVKMANKKYSVGSTDYEIVLERGSEVRVVFDDEEIRYFFKFVKFSEISNTVLLADIVGVVREVYDAVKVTVRSSGKETVKRDVMLLDDTGSVRVSLWGNKAEMEIERGDVLVVSNASVREYRGITLSTTATSDVLKNMDIEEAFFLKGWYEQGGKNTPIIQNVTDIKTINEVKTNEIKWSTFPCTVIMIKEDNLYYENCIECNKKVLSEDGKYRCEKCNKEYDTCGVRYFCQFEVGDFTDRVWMSAFDEGSKLFGISADKMREIRESGGESQIMGCIKGVYYRDFLIRAVMRVESYQGESRMKFCAVGVENVDYLRESRRILKIIKDSI